MIRQEKNALLLALAVAACRSTGPEALEVSAEAAPAPKAVEPQQGGDGSGQLAQDAQVLDLAQQRKAFLVASHIDNAKAWATRERVVDARGRESDPDERLMRAIEEKMEIPEARKADFRHELLAFVSAVQADGGVF